MSSLYLEDVESAVAGGRTFYACPGLTTSEWILSERLDDLRAKALRVANSVKHPVVIYRLLDHSDTTTGDSFLVVVKIIPIAGKPGDSKMQWALVDTKEAAEMMRDVSQGPSPYFGATPEEEVSPK